MLRVGDSQHKAPKSPDFGEQIQLEAALLLEIFGGYFSSVAEKRYDC
jgi:hypothetical protein